MQDDKVQYGADFETAESMEETVLYEKIDAHIAKITLNRPERKNAILSPAMNRVIVRRIHEAEEDDDVKVVLLTGNGSHFCAGEDTRRMPIESAGLKKGARLPQSVRVRTGRELAALHESILYSSKSLIAVVQGGAIGAGLHLALACDLIVASEGSRFARPQSRIGFASFNTALPLYLLKLGINRGYEAIITGRTMSAEQLKDWGVVASVVPEEQLWEEGIRYAKAVAHHSTDGLAIGRQAMAMFWDLLGVRTYASFVGVAHPLFTNLVWRDDEFNFLRERNSMGPRDAMNALNEKWQSLGFS